MDIRPINKKKARTKRSKLVACERRSWITRANDHCIRHFIDIIGASPLLTTCHARACTLASDVYACFWKLGRQVRSTTSPTHARGKNATSASHTERCLADGTSPHEGGRTESNGWFWLNLEKCSFHSVDRQGFTYTTEESTERPRPEHYSGRAPSALRPRLSAGLPHRQ
jgi:hypothetical protein